jgi:lipooligosaccharide transport system ATP-binding protein
MDEAEQLCDRLVVMDKAKIVAEGSPRELIERYVEREVVELRFETTRPDDFSYWTDGRSRVESLPDRVLSTRTTATRPHTRSTSAGSSRQRSRPPDRSRTCSCT